MRQVQQKLFIKPHQWPVPHMPTHIQSTPRPCWCLLIHYSQFKKRSRYGKEWNLPPAGARPREKLAEGSADRGKGAHDWCKADIRSRNSIENFQPRIASILLRLIHLFRFRFEDHALPVSWQNGPHPRKGYAHRCQHHNENKVSNPQYPLKS